MHMQIYVFKGRHLGFVWRHGGHVGWNKSLSSGNKIHYMLNFFFFWNEYRKVNSSLAVKRGCAFPMSLLWGVTISFVCLFFCVFLDLKPWRPLSFRERSGDGTRFQRRKNHQPRELQTSNRLGPWYLLAETVQACTIDQSCWNGLFAGV